MAKKITRTHTLRLDERDASIAALQEDLKESQKQVKSLLKKIAGVKSGIARRKTLENVVERCTYTQHTRSTQTNLQGAMVNDLIRVTETVDENVFKGEYIFPTISWL